MQFLPPAGWAILSQLHFDFRMRRKAQHLSPVRTYAQDQHLPSVLREYSRTVFQRRIRPGIRILHIENFHTNRKFSVAVTRAQSERFLRVTHAATRTGPSPRDSV